MIMKLFSDWKKVSVIMFPILLMMIIIIVIILTRDDKKDSIDVVVARYNEELDWMCDPRIVESLYQKSLTAQVEIFIYDKGHKGLDLTKAKACLPYVVFHVVRLPNVGRESHTYLHHVVARWTKLADVTIFLHGSSDAVQKFDRVKSTIEKVVQRGDSVFIGQKGKFPDIFDTFQIEAHRSSNSRNLLINPDTILEPAHKRPFGAWFRDVFQEEMDAVWNYCGIFAVSRKHILQHPRHYYQKLLSLVSSHPNPEAGHYFERSWGVVFAPLPDSCIYSS